MGNLLRVQHLAKKIDKINFLSLKNQFS